MYTKDIIDTKYIIYNTQKPKTPQKKTKGHGHGPSSTDNNKTRRADAPDKKLTSWRREKNAYNR